MDIRKILKEKSSLEEEVEAIKKSQASRICKDPSKAEDALPLKNYKILRKGEQQLTF